MTSGWHVHTFLPFSFRRIKEEIPWKYKDPYCWVHKPRVPRGPASMPGLGPGKQHVVHGPAQESKTRRAGRAVRSPTGRSTQKNKRPLVNFFSPPLRSEQSLRALAASDPASPTRDPVGSLLTALLRLAWPGPTGAIRPGTPARKEPGANEKGSAQVKP